MDIISLAGYLLLGCLLARIAALAYAEPRRRQSDDRVKTMVVLGSGGHTAEMLTFLRSMRRQRYSPMVFVVAATDRMGAAKAVALWQHPSDQVPDSFEPSQHTEIETIQRSREVGQSYLTSVASTGTALFAALRIVWRHRPELLLVNGPGTCIPVCAAALMFRLLGFAKTRVVYVESIARVASLSLSGAILYHSRLASAFYVQWPALQRLYPRSAFQGRLY